MYAAFLIIQGGEVQIIDKVNGYTNTPIVAVFCDLYLWWGTLISK